MTWEQEVQAEQMAFSLCDSDRMVGLTWKEVEGCIERFGTMLEAENIPLPTYENFHEADLQVMIVMTMMMMMMMMIMTYRATMTTP